MYESATAASPFMRLYQFTSCHLRAETQEGGPGLDRSMFRRLLVKQPGWATQPQEAASQQLPQNIAGSEPLWADHVARLTAVLSRCLPPFWQLGQVASLLHFPSLPYADDVVASPHSCLESSTNWEALDLGMHPQYHCCTGASVLSLSGGS